MSSRSTEQHYLQGTCLAGPWQLVGRTAWLALVGLSLLTFGVAIPARLRAIADPPPATLADLALLGLSTQAYAAFTIAIEGACMAAFTAIAAVIFLKRSDDWMALVVSGTLVAYAVYVTPTADALADSPAAWPMLSDLIQAIGLAGSLTVLCLFPDGRFVPRWTALLAAAWIVWAVVWVVVPDRPFSPYAHASLPPIWYVIYQAAYLTGLGVQIYRYAGVAGPVQRQQTKWVMFGLVVSIVGFLAVLLLSVFVPTLPEPGPTRRFDSPLTEAGILLSNLAIPAALAFSILRYRLWDIDLIVNRTFVYGALTAVLAGLYTASITLSQRLFVFLTGQQSDAAIVMTTLAVASAFTPVKTHLQAVADRHFKSAPPPADLLAGFVGQLRQGIWVIDPEQTAYRFLDEAVKAFGAQAGAIYLGPKGQERLIHSRGALGGPGGIDLPLTSGGISLGLISLGERTDGREYDPGDRAVLQQAIDDLVRAIASAGRAV